MQRLVKVDGKVRTDINYPVGFMDVISIEKSDEHFRLMYDAKGRFILHRLNNKAFSKEQEYKLCRVQAVRVGAKGVPCVTTHDGRTIRYPDPTAKNHDVLKVDIATGKSSDVIKFEVGATCIVTKGQNQGRCGVITGREKHVGSFEIVHDRQGSEPGPLWCHHRPREACWFLRDRARQGLQGPCLRHPYHEHLYHWQQGRRAGRVPAAVQRSS